MGVCSFGPSHNKNAGFGPHNSHWLGGTENLVSANGKHLAELEFKLSEHGPRCLHAHSGMSHEAEFYFQQQMSVALLYYYDYKFQVFFWHEPFKLIYLLFFFYSFFFLKSLSTPRNIRSALA